MAKTTKSAGATEILEVGSIKPAVDIKLDILSSDLVILGTVQAKNALTAELKSVVSRVTALTGEIASKETRKNEAIHAVDETDFLEAVNRAVSTLAIHYGSAEGRGLKVEQSVTGHTKADRFFVGTVTYRYDDSDMDVASFRIVRRYPMPAAISSLADEIDGLASEKSKLEAYARDLRVQIQDRDGLRDQVSAGLTRELLKHSDGVGQAMLAALVAGVDSAENPILALLDGRPGK